MKHIFIIFFLLFPIGIPSTSHAQDDTCPSPEEIRYEAEMLYADVDWFGERTYSTQEVLYFDGARWRRDRANQGRITCLYESADGQSPLTLTKEESFTDPTRGTLFEPTDTKWESRQWGVECESRSVFECGF